MEGATQLGRPHKDPHKYPLKYPHKYPHKFVCKHNKHRQ